MRTIDLAHQISISAGLFRPTTVVTEPEGMMEIKV